MGSYVQNIKTESGDIIYPITSTKAVFDEDGKSIDQAIKDTFEKINSLSWELVDQLPSIEEAKPNIVYAIPNGGETADNQRTEYIFDSKNKRFEKWGSSDINLSGFVTEETFNELDKSAIRISVDDDSEDMEAIEDLDPGLDFVKTSETGKFLHLKNTHAGKAEVKNVVRNLIKYPYLDGDSKTHNGITYTVNDDGSVTANGTATNTSYFFVSNSKNKIDLDDGTYILTGCPAGGSASTYSVFLWFHDKDTDESQKIALNDIGNGSIKVAANSKYYGGIRIMEGTTVESLTFRFMLEKGSVSHSYVSPNTHHKIKSVGKNLLPFPYVYKSITRNGVTYTVLDDQSISIVGTATDANSYMQLTGYSNNSKDKILKLPVGTYEIQLINNKNNNIIHAVDIRNGDDYSYIKRYNGFEKNTSLNKELELSELYVDNSDYIINYSIGVNKGVTVNETIKVQIVYKDKNETPYYEPYKSSEIEITPDTDEVYIETFDGVTNIIADTDVSVNYGINKFGTDVITTKAESHELKQQVKDLTAAVLELQTNKDKE